MRSCRSAPPVSGHQFREHWKSRNESNPHPTGGKLGENQLSDAAPLTTLMGMIFWRGFAAIAGFSALSVNLMSCRSNQEETVVPEAPASGTSKSADLPQVDTSQMTKREKEDWQSYVNEFLAPCSDQPVSLAQCVSEKRACDACLPAAEFIAKRVQRGEPRADVEAAYRSRFSPDTVQSVPMGDSPWKGAADAPVVIVEWADFECPFCRAAAPVMDELLKRYPGSIKMVFKNYPLSMHPNAEIAAKAVIAAGNQGKFWKLHEALFSPALTVVDKTTILQTAETVGLDVKLLQKDMESEAVAKTLAAEKEEATKLGLRGTPLLFINGREYLLETFKLVEAVGERVVPAEDVLDWISLELKLMSGVDAKQPAPAPANGAPANTPAAPTPQQ